MRPLSQYSCYNSAVCILSARTEARQTEDHGCVSKLTGPDDTTRPHHQPLPVLCCLSLLDRLWFYCPLPAYNNAVAVVSCNQQNYCLTVIYI